MAVDPIKKRSPIILPAFTWDEEDFDWLTRPVSWDDAADLPVAYLRDRLEMQPDVWDLGDDNPNVRVLYAAASANARGGPLRAPRVLFVPTEDTYPDAPWALPGYSARVEALGLIVATLTPPPFDPDLSYQRDAMTGTPVRLDPDAEVYVAKTPETYIGGRCLVVYGPLRGGQYYGGIPAPEVHLYDAEPASTAYCESLGMTGGAESLPASYETPTDPTLISFIVDERVEADTAALAEAAARFDRFRIYFTPVPDGDQIASWAYTPQQTCKSVDTDVSSLVDNEGGSVVTGSEDFTQSMRDMDVELIARIGGAAVLASDYPSFETILSFFEEA